MVYDLSNTASASAQGTALRPLEQHSSSLYVGFTIVLLPVSGDLLSTKLYGSDIGYRIHEQVSQVDFSISVDGGGTVVLRGAVCGCCV